jgi:hypothetical protein
MTRTSFCAFTDRECAFTLGQAPQKCWEATRIDAFVADELLDVANERLCHRATADSEHTTAPRGLQTRDVNIQVDPVYCLGLKPKGRMYR